MTKSILPFTLSGLSAIALVAIVVLPSAALAKERHDAPKSTHRVPHVESERHEHPDLHVRHHEEHENEHEHEHPKSP
jgi:ABC-type Zn2+ transport system substrate-binding protein/surface adhesin